jgi:hypothetical protein
MGKAVFESIAKGLHQAIDHASGKKVGKTTRVPVPDVKAISEHKGRRE